MGVSEEQLQPFQGTLSGFTGERVHVRGYITLKTIFGTGKQAKTIKIRYLVVNAPNSYNIVIGRPSFNRLGALLSTKFLVMKYPLDDGGFGTIKGDQKVARECYLASLKLRRKETPRKDSKGDSVNMIDLDSREEYQQERLEPTEALKEVMIGPHPHQSTKIGTSLAPSEEEDLIQPLRRNLDLFAWAPSDMSGIDPCIACHPLDMNPTVKPVVQRKRKMGEERRKAVDEDVKRLQEARFISEIKYPTWLANTVLVKKA